MFMKILATEKSYNATPPPQTILVGLMKHYFFCAFLSLLLASCGGGGGGSDSGASSKKKAKSCTTTIANGKGEIPWDKKTKKHTTCTVISCNAGFDNDVDSTKCQQTASGFYSLAKDKTRKTCPTTIPSHSLNNTITGLKLETDCWKCESGSLKNTKQKKCTLPTKGKYYDQGTLKDCSSVGGTPPEGFKNWEDNTAPVASDNNCAFSCKDEFTKSESLFSCNKSKPCLITNGGGLNLWNIIADDFSTTCTVETCNAGFDNEQDSTQCQQTAANFYSPANDKTRTACPTPSNSSPTAATGSNNPQGCFNCNAGYWRNPQGSGSCDVPDLGKWVDATNNSKKDCTPITPNTNFNTWLAGPAAANDACPFSCSGAFSVHTSRRTCIVTTQSCSSVPNGSGTQNWETPNDRYGTCTVETCNAGFVKNTGANSCNIPDTGKYADNGVEKSCSPITGDSGGFDAFAVNTGAVSTPTGCGFSCNTGYVKDSSGRACNYPTPGTYVNASGAEVGCTDITGITGFGSWLEGAATADDACPFSCASGYTVSGRICRKPEMLALGEDTSRILFSTGEVEAWGRVSDDHFWRTHLKEDLGGNTPQALVSRNYHQCIILKNGNLNHGRLMCWGKNDDEQLGVGDANPRSTPTAVTATILGDAGGGVPNTVKSVALGDYHTCAILHDDTVVCWGDNTYAQIGGGSSGFGKTTRGTVGGPLGSTTARRIAMGSIHTCAVLSDSSVECWGRNFKGQTGGGTPNLGAGRTATEIAMSSEFSCAILDDDSVKCWGANGATNYIGTGGVPDLGVNRTATGIALGYEHACVLLNNKTVKCWGKNDHGQVGGGSASSDHVLRGTSGDPLGGQTAIEIAAGYKHTCAVMESDHSVKCWGVNRSTAVTSYGQIIGEVAMTGGTNGTGTSTGESQVLTAVATPTATALDSDASGKICKIELSGGTLGTPWVAKNYTTPLTYNTGGSTVIADVIDSLIAEIGSTVTLATTDVTLSKSGTNKIVATVNSAVFEGMTLTIFHDDDGGNCTTNPVGTPITLSGASGAAKAEGTMGYLGGLYPGIGR